MTWLVAAHAAVTWALVGLIWTIQLVHYPLFARVGEAGFAAYSARHSAAITPLVGPLMGLELVSAGWLALHPPAFTPAWAWWAGLALALLVWASTGLVQVPLHRRLGGGFSGEAHARLVRSNWLRTVAWSARGLLVGWLVWLLMR